jgi:hypothetical protein
VALKDFIVAFFGWLVLMGRNGMSGSAVPAQRGKTFSGTPGVNLKPGDRRPTSFLVQFLFQRVVRRPYTNL